MTSRKHELGRMDRLGLILEALQFNPEKQSAGKLAVMTNEQLIAFILDHEEKDDGPGLEG